MSNVNLSDFWSSGDFKKTTKFNSLEDRFIGCKLYVKNTKTIFDIFEEGHSLNKDSRVFEIGCALARNLREARNRYNCYVEGCDINEEMIEMTKNFFKGDRCRFYIQDILQPFLGQYDDKYFDFTIAYEVLTAVRPCKEKTHLINELIRVSKCLYMQEYYDEKIKIQEREINGYQLVWEDYQKYNDKIKIRNGFKSGYSKLFIFDGN